MNLTSAIVEGRNIVTVGRWPKIAQIKSEEFAESQPIAEPRAFLAELRKAALSVDIFTFAQSIHELEPKFRHYDVEWDNFAAIRLSTYDDWWQKLSQDSRRNVRIAKKRGVEIRVASFDDKLIKGIKSIYDETPIRQGFRNRHYQDDLETVKRKNSTYLESSEFLVAEFSGETIGFAQIVYIDGTARIMQILCKLAHLEKRASNALVAKAVEVACHKGLTHLTYCKYTYGKKEKSPLTEFKRRMGFEKLCYPRYYVPLTLRGEIAMKFGLHLGLKNLVPPSCLRCLLDMRSRYYQLRFGLQASSGGVRSLK